MRMNGLIMVSFQLFLVNRQKESKKYKSSEGLLGVERDKVRRDMQEKPRERSEGKERIIARARTCLCPFDL